MTDIEWGPAIAVDGKRPGWLERHTPLRWYGRGMTQEWWDRGDGDDFTTAEQLCWADNITSIALPADHPHYRQTEKVTGGDLKVGDTHVKLDTVDWSKPIEAVHQEGRVYAATTEVIGLNRFARFNGNRIIVYDNGKAQLGGGWFIRNVAENIRNSDVLPTPQADTKPDLTAEVASEAIALVKWMDEKRGQHSDYYTRFGFEAWTRARAIVALLPEPVDEDLVEARECVAEVYEQSGRADLAQQTRGGHHDNRLRVQSARLALARGRALALAGEKEA